MAKQRATWPFAWTLAVFGAAAGWSWFHHDWLLECWIAPLLEGAGRARDDISSSLVDLSARAA